MKKLLVVGAICFGTSLALALPPAGEITKAQKVVSVLMADDMAALKAGKKTPVEVGDAAVAFSKEAETETMKYVLLKGALDFYVRGKDYDKAADAAEAMRVSVKDLAPEDLVDAIRSSARGVRGSAAPRLLAILRTARAQAKAKEGIAAAKRALRKDAADVTARRALAEWLAASGDWTQALEAFIELGGKAGKTAQAETEQKDLVAVADFWWEYEPGVVPSPDVFKAHAATLYKQELEKGELTGLKKMFVEKRIKGLSEMANAVDEVQKPKGRPKDELAALKKICNAKGLIHCWRFNGDLKDCVGASDAQTIGEVKIGNQQIDILKNDNPSYIELGEGLIPNDGSPVTIELWATAQKVEGWSHVFCFGQRNGLHSAMSWGGDPQIYISGRAGVTPHEALTPFDEGNEYHICIVYAPNDNHSWSMHAYKQDAKTGKTIKKASRDHHRWSLKHFPVDTFHLGENMHAVRASVSYNEVRIWNRVLDEKELTQNAVKFYKAGEARKEQKR